MEYNDSQYRAGGASRPPRPRGGEDTPLFTDEPYAPTRRTGGSGRPAEPFSSGRGGASAERTAPTRSAQSASPYGGRVGSSRSAASGSQTSCRPAASGRAAPVYTELSWDQLRQGTDSSSPGARTNAYAPAPTSAEPTQRAASPYFGGFEQEMDDLFYRCDAPAPRAPRQESAPAYAEQMQYAATPRQIRENTVARQRARQTQTPARTGERSRFLHASSPRRQEVRSVAPSRAGATPPPSGPVKRPSVRRRPGGSGKIPPAFLAGALAVLALLILLISRGVSSHRAKENAILYRPGSNPSSSFSQPTATPVATAAPTADPNATPEVTPNVTPTPKPTPVPTPTPNGPKAKKSGELVVPAAWGPAVPERSVPVYDSHFDRSIMVGNSLVEGFFMWAGMSEHMDFVYNTGAVVTDVIGRLDLAKITLNQPGYYTDIYLMFGLNEVGTDVNSFTRGYKKLVDFIRQYQPTANIYLISVTPVTEEVDKDPNEVQNMDRIRNFNSAMQAFCEDNDCWYLDIYSMLLDENGYLSADYAYAGDGKHFEKSGYVAWANYMKTHYVDEALLTE